MEEIIRAYMDSDDIYILNHDTDNGRFVLLRGVDLDERPQPENRSDLVVAEPGV